MGTVEEAAKKQAEALRSEIRAIVREEIASMFANTELIVSDIVNAITLEIEKMGTK